MPTSFEAKKSEDRLLRSKNLFLYSMNAYLLNIRKRIGRLPFERLDLFKGMKVAEIKGVYGPTRWWEAQTTTIYLPIVKVLGLKGIGIESIALLDTNANLFSLYLPEESTVKNDVMVSLNSHPYANRNMAQLVPALTDRHRFLRSSSPIYCDLVRISMAILKPTTFTRQEDVDNITKSLNEGPFINQAPFDFRRN